MAYITPGTIVDLMSVAMDPTYNHVRYFATNADKNDYFDGKIVRTLTAQTYQNYTDGTIRLSVTPSQVLNCNYMRFRNVGYENKNYYAFIISTTDISNECVEINFKIDSFMTYWMDYNTTPCFVERMHTRTDAIGDNIESEPIQAALIPAREVTVNTNHDYYLNPYNVLSTSVLTEQPDQGQQYVSMRTINGQRMVARILVCNPNESGSETIVYDEINRLNSGGSGATMDNIISFKSAPSWACQLDNQGYRIYNPSNTVDPVIYLHGFHGYGTPRNYKLMTSQFCNLIFWSSDGASVTLRPEFFDSTVFTSATTIMPTVKETCVLTGDISVIVEMSSYDYNQKLSRVTVSGFPDIQLTKSLWAEWAARNANALGFQLATNAIMTQGASVVPDSVGLFGEIISTQANITHSQSPSIGGISANSMLAIGQFGWAIIKNCVSAQDAEHIDTFFDIYGYAVNDIALPTRKIRDKYTYIKTRDFRVNGSIPVDAIDEISNAYNNGVTFWADNANFMNYALAVRQANSLH